MMLARSNEVAKRTVHCDKNAHLISLSLSLSVLFFFFLSLSLSLGFCPSTMCICIVWLFFLTSVLLHSQLGFFSLVRQTLRVVVRSHGKLRVLWNFHIRRRLDFLQNFSNGGVELLVGTVEGFDG